MPTVIQPGQKILFIGDSITDCDRRNPVHAPLGGGYVRLFADFLALREPEKKITVLNRGIGGNTVDDLRSRWQDDALGYRPDWLSVKIGINDLNTCLCGKDPDWLNPAMFEAIYREILTLARQALPDCQLLLVSPFFLSRDTNHPKSYRSRVLRVLPEYIAAVEKMVREFGARYVPMQDIFFRHLEHLHPDDLAPEPVHPHQTGHLLMAESVYAALS